MSLICRSDEEVRTIPESRTVDVRGALNVNRPYLSPLYGRGCTKMPLTAGRKKLRTSRSLSATSPINLATNQF